MTTEKLTDDERECLLEYAGGDGDGVAEKALRVIDAQAAEIERLRSEPSKFEIHAREHMASLSKQLAAANALLERAREKLGPQSMWTVSRAALHTEIEAHLAGKAAPRTVGTCAEVCGSLLCEQAGGPDCLNRKEPEPLPWDAEDQALAEYGMRTAAEQRVLDAMAALNEATLGMQTGAWSVVADAELARRGLDGMAGARISYERDGGACAHPAIFVHDGRCKACGAELARRGLKP